MPFIRPSSSRAAAYLGTAALAPLAMVLGSATARADTTVSSNSSTPLVTASAGSVTIATGATLTVPSGTAVTVNSNNNVTVNGNITTGGADNQTGITQNSGTTSTISNAGTITLSENYIPTNLDSSNITVGPISVATGRYGILSQGGTGSIANSGSIVIQGYGAAGIGTTGTYTGDINNTGTLSVLGDNSFGIHTNAVTGNVIAGGTILVAGPGAVGVETDGEITGNLNIQGSISQSVTYTDYAGTTVTLARSALRERAAAVQVSGNVDGGILVYSPVSSTSTTTPNSDTASGGTVPSTSGSVTSEGNGPAIQIGGATNITIGTITGNEGTYSLAVDGSVSGNAYYTSTDAYGVVVGGKGGNVTMSGGIGVSSTGSIKATTVDSGAYALVVNAGSSVPNIYNSGTISSSLSSPGEGTSIAILDNSGTLTKIDNTGFISASGSSTDVTQAINLAANTSGVTITQGLNAYDASTKASNEASSGTTDTTVYTSITGDILTGSGNDTITVSAGTITGNTYLGGGSDTIALSGNAAYTGSICAGGWGGSSSTGSGTFSCAGAGQSTFTMTMTDTATFSGAMDLQGYNGTLTIGGTAVWLGTLANAQNLAVTVNGGLFGAKSATTLTMGSLSVGSGGEIEAYIDGTTGTSSKMVVLNTATFASGSKVAAIISSLKGAEGSYTILSAGSLQGSPSFDSATTELPYLFKGSVAVSGNDLVLTIAQKAPSELGLNRAGTSAITSIIESAAAATTDATIAESLLAIYDADTLKTQVYAMLPDHAGGVFDAATRGDRLVAKHIEDANSVFTISNVGAWLEPVFWHSSQAEGASTSFNTQGWGISFGFERRTTIGDVGFSYAFLSGKVHDNGGTQDIGTSQHDFGLFWRKVSGPLYTFARIGAGHVGANSSRTFTGIISSTDFTRTATAKWGGWLFSAMAGASYDAKLTSRWTLRPKVVVDYYHLHEGGYTEAGGGDAINLTVDGRTSTQLTATPTLTASYSFGEKSQEGIPLTIELEGGRQQRIGGSLGATTATFVNSSSFTITPDNLKSGWLGSVRLLSGGMDYTWQLEGRAQRTGDSTDYSIRAGISLAF